MAFRRTSPAEFHERMAVKQEEAGAAYASEMSTATDAARRQFLADKAKRAKEAAAHHRELAARIRREGD
jgi:hypothetical protein